MSLNSTSEGATDCASLHRSPHEGEGFCVLRAKGAGALHSAVAECGDDLSISHNVIET